MMGKRQTTLDESAKIRGIQVSEGYTVITPFTETHMDWKIYPRHKTRHERKGNQHPGY